MKRLFGGLLVAFATSSLLAHAEQKLTPEKEPAVQQASKLTTPSAIKPASLVGLTKAQVETKLGKPSVAFTTVWNYKQPQGTLRVQFKDGIVTEAKTDVDAAPVGKGYTNTAGVHIQSPRKADSPPAGASARCRDGSYSFSASRRGTCSHHGGVAQWL